MTVLILSFNSSNSMKSSLDKTLFNSPKVIIDPVLTLLDIAYSILSAFFSKSKVLRIVFPRDLLQTESLLLFKQFVNNSLTTYPSSESVDFWIIPFLVFFCKEIYLKKIQFYPCLIQSFGSILLKMSSQYGSGIIGVSMSINLS